MRKLSDTWCNEGPELLRRLLVAEEALVIATTKGHEGECYFTDKSDEGCYLCAEVENERWEKLSAALKTIRGEEE